MTVQQLVNGVIYAGTVAGALSGIGLFFHWALVRPLRGFLRREIVNNLVDIRHAVEHSTTETATLGVKLDEHIAQATTRDQRLSELAARFDDHLAHHPAGTTR